MLDVVSHQTAEALDDLRLLGCEIHGFGAVRAQIDTQIAAYAALVQSQQQRLNLSELRYKQGVERYLAVLTAQRDLYAAQQGLIRTRYAREANLVALYRALGGGWDRTP